MAHDLVPVQVDPNSADQDFWRRYHAFRRTRHEETRPDDPLIPDEVAEKRIRRPYTFFTVYFYEISQDGEMISWFRGDTARPDSPEYATNHQFFHADWAVRRDRRRQAIGRSWLPLVLELMDRHGCTVLTLAAEEESGHEFLRWLSAQPKATGAENRLRIADVDWAMVKRWIEEGQTRNPDTKLEIYDGHLPESMVEEYAQQRSLLLNTMPWDDLDHGEIVVTPERIHEWWAQMDLVGEVDHTILTREPDGTLSAMTDMTYAPYLPTFIEQQLTAVHPSARGRGLGKWIKAAMLDHVHRLYPDVLWVSTGNADSNAPMLAINTRLGFRQYRGGSEYQMSRDELAERIRKLAARL
jgi:mycothiol synthase